MVRLDLISRSTLTFLALLIGVILFLPGKAHSVVTDIGGVVTGPGGKPLGGATLIITNEETGDKVEDKTDRDGGFLIPLIDKNWKRGWVTVTVKDNGRTVGTQRVNLADGSNRGLNISTAMAGYYPGSSLAVHGGVRLYDGSRFGASPDIIVEFTGPGFMQDTFTLQPYANVWSVPDVQVLRHRPYDTGIFQFKVDDGSMYGVNVGLKHTSDLSKWGISTGSARILGSIKVGAGYVNLDFDTKRVPIGGEFTRVKNFSSGDDAFRWEIGFAAGAEWPNGWFFLLDKLTDFTYTDILNGGRKVRVGGGFGIRIGKKFDVR